MRERLASKYLYQPNLCYASFDVNLSMRDIRLILITMLKQLTVQNFIIVSHLNIQFEKGLTTITGESGAGKSILLGAINLILGHRASSDLVSPGANQSSISAEFDLKDCEKTAELLRESGILDTKQKLCLIRRTISADGGSRAFINETPVTLKFLQEATQPLINICDQNENQHLTEIDNQTQFLDNYSGQTKRANLVKDLFKNWKNTEKKVSYLLEENKTLGDRRELLNYQLDELQALSLSENEFNQIENDHRRLSNAKQLIDTTQEVLESILSLDEIRLCDSKLSAINDSDQNLESARANLQSALSLVDDAERDLKRFRDQIVIDPESLMQVEGRLNLIIGAAKKHRIDPTQITSHVQQLQKELQKIEQANTGIEELQEEAAQLKKSFLEESRKLSTERKKHQKDFCEAVEDHMSSLGIKQGKLVVSFKEEISSHGIESVEFLVQTNPNFKPASLRKIASGGEQTRIFLGIQIVAAKTTKMPSLILDEADVGVGGTTADTIGRLLLQLGSNTQVICITHAPQVAAIGQNHLRVIKDNSETTIEPLNEDMRVEELARMLAGADITEKTRDYAHTLLKEANLK